MRFWFSECPGVPSARSTPWLSSSAHDTVFTTLVSIYVGEDVARRALERGTELGGQERDVAVQVRSSILLGGARGGGQQGGDPRRWEP
jgi:hypothetical protein